MTRQSLQISIGIENDPDPAAMEARTAEVEERARAALSGVQGIEIEDTAVLTPANLDPAALTELAALIRLVGDVALAGAGAIGAGAAVLEALRRFAAASGALVRTIAVEIGGTPKPLSSVTTAEIDAELRRPA